MHDGWGGGDYVLVCGARCQTQVKTANDARSSRNDCPSGANECHNRADGFGYLMPTRECGPNGRKPSTEFQMRNTTFTSSVAGALLFGGTLGVATAANAATTTILDLATAGAYGSVTKNATVGGQSNVTTLGGPVGITWGSATGGTRPGSTQTSGFGMQASGNAGVGGWAGTQGALLSDITGASFDWYNSNAAQGLGGGFRLYMYVYAPTSDISGYLQFDLSYLLPNQTGMQWNSTGNYLSGATGSAWYSTD